MALTSVTTIRPYGWSSFRYFGRERYTSCAEIKNMIEFPTRAFSRTPLRARIRCIRSRGIDDFGEDGYPHSRLTGALRVEAFDEAEGLFVVRVGLESFFEVGQALGSGG